jgi:hypothetical protein
MKRTIPGRGGGVKAGGKAFYKMMSIEKSDNPIFSYMFTGIN